MRQDILLGLLMAFGCLLTVQSANLDSRGFRNHVDVRCQGHYQELVLATSDSPMLCETSCNDDLDCRSFSRELQPTTDTYSCFLFNEKSSCVSFNGWESGFKDTRCAIAGENEFVNLACPIGTVISRVTFASYGTPSGSCGSFREGSCHDNRTKNIIEDICVGESSCRLSITPDVFADACPFSTKNLRAQVECSAGPSFFEDLYFNDWSSQSWAAAETQTAARASAWRDALARVQPYPEAKYQGQGIVMVAGGRYLQSALVTIKMLRDFGCALPIEVWHLGAAEVNPQQKQYLKHLNVQTRDFEDFVESSLLKPIAANVGLRLFQLKPLAILHSSFRDVLLLDSDNSILKNPTYLFASSEFKQYGAIFWPDYWKTTPENPIWSIVGVFPSNTWEQESGQLLINKQASWSALNLCLHFNDEFYMRLLNGDKDTFRFAWIASNTPFHMIETAPIAVGTLKQLHSSATGFCGHSMLQHDFHGSAIFLHHNQLKSAVLPAGENFRFQKSILSDNGEPIHAVAVSGLKLSSTEIPCTDYRGIEYPFIDEDHTQASESNLAEFERIFLATVKSIAVDFDALAATVTIEMLDPFFHSLKNHPHMKYEPFIPSQHKVIDHQTHTVSRRQSSSFNQTCNSAEYEASPQTATSNRLCLPVSVCSSDEYESAPPTLTSDRCCKLKTVCQENYDPYEVEVAPATSTNDTQCQKKACACTGQLHPTLSLLQPGYGSFCGQWVSGAATFCYVNASCPSATLDLATGWYIATCTCGDQSAGGSTCSNAAGYSYDLVAQGDVGTSSFEHWYEFSTARDPTYILAQVSGGQSSCASLCNNEFDCLGFQIETDEFGTVTCTVLSNIGHRVRTTASTKSFMAVVPAVSPVAIGQNLRFSNAFNVDHQVFIQTNVSDPNICVNLCSADLFCKGVYIARCPSSNAGICIGLSQVGDLIADPLYSFNVIVMYPRPQPWDAAVSVSVTNKTSADQFFNQGSPKVYNLNFIDGVSEHAPTLTVSEGLRFKFQMAESHISQPIFITTSPTGGPSSTVYTAGVENSFASENDAMYFTPSSSSPRTLYYQSYNEELVGGRIRVVQPFAINAQSCPSLATTTQAPVTTTPTPTTLALFELVATGAQGSTPLIFSTTFDVAARLFVSTQPSEAAALADCQSRCSADIDNCEGFVLISGHSTTSCVGLQHLGSLIPTQTTSQSYGKD